MLEIRDLHKVYGKYHALNGLNMTVRDGAMYGFVGPNGAGKTTTIKIMAGLLGADGGSVMIGGEDGLASPARLKKMIGYVPDFFGVYDNLTVSEYMEFFASCYNLDGLVARKRYTALLGVDPRSGNPHPRRAHLGPGSQDAVRIQGDFERFTGVRADDFYQLPCALRAVGALHGHRDTGPGKAGAGG